MKPKCAREVGRALGRPIDAVEARAIEMRLMRALRQDRAAAPDVWAGRSFEHRILGAAERLARETLARAHEKRIALGRRPGRRGGAGRRLNQPAFYSAVERAVADSQTQRASGAQWWATISHAPGVKKEELEWIGLEDWLAAQDGVAREDVLAFVRENGVRVEETVLGGESVDPEVQRELLPLIEERDRVQNAMMDGDNSVAIAAATADARVQAAYSAFREATARAEDLLLRSLAGEDISAESVAAANRLADQKRLELRSEARDLRARLSERIGELRGGKTDTKWSQYTLAGGENYRELLLTLPPMTNESRAISNQLAEMARQLHEEFGERWVSTAPPERLAEYDALGDRQEALEKAATYRSSHFDQPNILAHVRFNERVDAEGRRTLFIEELQSDWHQAGRERGYRDEALAERIAEIDRRAAAIMSEWTNKDRSTPEATAAMAQWSALQSERRALVKQSAGVPDAPFKNNAWARLALKRMIRWAAENGFDQIAWTTGQHQLDRGFGVLAENVSSVAYNPETRRFMARRKDSAFTEENVDAARLHDLVGKEIATQLLAAPRDGVGFHTLATEGIKVGAGQRAFYDRIMVNIANDLGKKYGARVGEASIVAKKGSETVHALEIPPAMRDEALGGQRLFQDDLDDPGGARRGETAIPEGGIFDDPGVIVTLFETADHSTPFHEFGHVYLETIKAYAARAGAPEALLRDWAAIKAWLGIGDDGEIPTGAHEKFARGFEAYLREGKPPTPALESPFAAFKRWLVALYRSVTQLDVELTPEIRAVFDRLTKDPVDGVQSQLLEPGAGGGRSGPRGEPGRPGAAHGGAQGERPGPGGGDRTPGAERDRGGGARQTPALPAALTARDPELAQIQHSLEEARAEIDALERQGQIQPAEAAQARADLVAWEKVAKLPELMRAAAFCLMHGARVNVGG